MTQRLSDHDVERIATRVVEKLVRYALVIVAAAFLAPLLLFPLLSATASATLGLPFPIAVAILASVLAAPMVALIWLWGRRTR